MAAVLITGANRGLGFEFARQYATDGWRALTACRNPATAGELRRLAQDRRGRLNVVAMDVTDAQSVREAATQLKDISIDVLINSAGIAGVPGQRTGNVDYESWGACGPHGHRPRQDLPSLEANTQPKRRPSGSRCASLGQSVCRCRGLVPASA
jgi:NAD(P)-dependent dehydrogenase (short-subunit alcohol dehydrogenase family)